MPGVIIPNHVIAIVGYDTINGTDVFILRNSWGTGSFQKYFNFFVNIYLLFQAGEITGMRIQHDQTKTKWVSTIMWFIQYSNNFIYREHLCLCKCTNTIFLKVLTVSLKPFKICFKSGNLSILG